METDQYLDVFIDESAEHLDTLYKQLLALEKSPTEKPIIEEIFRAAHTLKGMSATMGYQDLANLTHNLENVFDGVRYDRITVDSDKIDIMFEAVDHMNAMVEEIANGGEGHRDVEETLKHLEQIEKGTTADTETEVAVTKEEVSEAVDLTIGELDEFEMAILNESKDRGFTNYEIKITLSEACLLKGARVFMIFGVLEELGEVIKAEPSVNDLEEEKFEQSFKLIFVSEYEKEHIAEMLDKVSEVEEIIIENIKMKNTNDESKEEPSTDTAIKEEIEEEMKEEKKEVKKDQPKHNNKQAKADNRPKASRKTIRVNIDRLDILMNLFEELVIDRGRLEQISMDLNHTDLQETVEHMSRVSGDLQNIILNMRMVPVDSVFDRFPRMIRQLARGLNKQVEIEIVGADTELDRTVIDEIGDPLVHLIRNAMDHGIETPEERKKKGKPEQGIIELKAYQGGNYVFIEIKDDGAGINKDKVLNKAIENGVVQKEDAHLLTDQQIYELILESGFSTADKISDVSGRGVGLDVVKNTIEKLGGSITIDATYNEGSVFSIQLPLTISIIAALLVEIENEKYAIPLSSIIETVIIHKDNVLSAHNKKVIDFRDKVIPLVYLKDIFSVPDFKEKDDYISIVIVKKGDKTAGLVVDSFIRQQEVVLKSLGDYLKDIPAISGATILGDGQVALIIDSNALVK